MTCPAVAHLGSVRHPETVCALSAPASDPVADQLGADVGAADYLESLG